MIYDLSIASDREQFKEKTAELLTKESRVDLKIKYPPRSISQNRYFHLICGWFGAEFGYTTEEVKELIKTQVCPDIFQYEKNDQVFTKSTSALNSAEMSQVIDQFRAWSDALGFYIESPDEEQFIAHAERVVSRNQYV